VRLAIACALASASCAQLIAPNVGPVAGEECSNIDSDPEHDVSFAIDIQHVIAEYHCPDCHTPGGKTPLGLEVGGLDLSSYETLRAGGVNSGANIIVPGMACGSVFLQKLGAGPPFGSRMPLDGPPYVDEDDLAKIADWIIEGAHDN